MTRNWTDGSGLALDAANLNGIEADIVTAQSTANTHASRHANGGADPLYLPVNAKLDFGAKGDAKTISGGSITAATNTLTASGFASTDVGKAIAVVGAGVSGATLVTTISGYTSSTQVTLAANASTTVSDSSVTWGTDDTVAIQNWVTYCITNNRLGFASSSNYLLTATINFSCRPNFALNGAGQELTVFLMAPDNTPIFNLGSDTASYMHNIGLHGMSFSYANSLQTGNTSANPILFSQMVYESSFTDLGFDGGSYAMRVANGIGGPWGCRFDHLCFNSNLTGGAMDWSQCVNAVPNNKFGRMFVSGQNMQDSPSLAIFDVRGYNFEIDVIEFIAVNHGKTLLRLAPGSRCEIGSIKLENGVYSQGGNVYLIDPGNGSHAWVTIGQINISGDTSPSPTLTISNNTNVYVIRSGGDGVECDFIDLGASTAIPSGSGLYALTSTEYVTFGNVKSSSGYWTGLTNNGSTTTANFVRVKAQLNDRLSDNKGDASYTVTLGDPNIISYETPLTAARTITLPSDNTKLFNGLYYEVRVYGATPTSTNSLTVVNGGTTLATITTDKVVYRWTWRRVASGNGWVMTKYGTLP